MARLMYANVPPNIHDPRQWEGEYCGTALGGGVGRGKRPGACACPEKAVKIEGLVVEHPRDPHPGGWCRRCGQPWP